MNFWKIAAGLWGLVVLLCGAVVVRSIEKGSHYESELLSLLPSDVSRPLVARAIDRMADSGSKGTILLVGSEDELLAGRAATICAASLREVPGIAHVVSEVDVSQADLVRQFYLPFRYGLLTAAQQKQVGKASNDELVQRALQQLYGPIGPPRLLPLEADPLGLFSEALLDAATGSALTFSNGHLVVHDGATTWVAVLAELDESGVSMSERKSLLHVFDEADNVAKKMGAKTLRAGFVFHAAVASHQAENEISTIGVGSLVGIMFLVIFTFRSLRPLLLVILPVATGSVTSLGLSLLLFPKLHLITLVFGTSIIGVAVDYGFIFLAGRMASGEWNADKRRVEMLPVVTMALTTSILAYAVLVALPFPILRQMGIFTILGLVAAYLTALLWVPLLGRHLTPIVGGPMHWLIRHAQALWPRIDGSPTMQLGLALLSLVSIVGIFRASSNDDVHGLYAAEANLVRQQGQVEKLMRLPTAGQFFLVSGASEEDVLLRDEALAEQLELLKAQGVISGYESPARFVPSKRSQVLARAFHSNRVFTPGGIADAFFGELGQPDTAAVAKAEFDRFQGFLTPETWLASPISMPFRPLWLGAVEGEGFADIVTVSGVRDATGFAQLAMTAQTCKGVEWVNHLRSLSELLGRFRREVVNLMFVGYAVVAVLLALRYRGRAWRVFTPAFLAVLVTAGFFGWMGLNVNLFCVFGLLLSLDMGIDYGIYVQDRRAGDAEVALLGAWLSGIATILSFGLLALSQTPALSIFGLSVFLCISGSLLLVPVFAMKEGA